MLLAPVDAGEDVSSFSRSLPGEDVVAGLWSKLMSGSLSSSSRLVFLISSNILSKEEVKS